MTLDLTQMYAAAPDLFRALLGVVQCAECRGWDCDPALCLQLEAARDALAAAGLTETEES